MLLESQESFFESFKKSITQLDPVNFCEDNLTLDGFPFRLNGNGYKPFSDIYRYIGVKALEENSKKIVLVKGRQVGATTMAAALECYFVGCGLFGNNGRPPIRLMHLFPSLALASAYTKDKFDPMISLSKPVPGLLKKNGLLKTILESKFDTSSPSNNNIHFKKFIDSNQIWIESTGATGDRIRGRQLCLETELPTPTGFVKLKNLKQGDQLFDENGEICNVTKLHPINESPESYRIIFDDGTAVDACAEHLWVTKTNNGIKTRSTREILETLSDNHSIPLCKPVQYSKKKLEIDPYIVGLWIEGDPSDAKIMPKGYLEASVEQRIAFLQGLMEADGSCDKDGRYKLKCKQLAKQTLQLIHSLGIKTEFVDNSIYFYTTLIIYKKFQSLKEDSERFIKSIEKIDPKPMRCITVNSSSHLYLITKSFIPTHNTVDVAFYDECQDIPHLAIGAVSKVLSKAHYGRIGEGVQVFFGTPKQKSTAYWNMWKQSTQQYFHLGCENCGKHFPLYRPDVNWEDIWLYGFIVKCTECNHEQDKRPAADRGRWIGLVDNDSCEYVGYHINQLYIPTFPKEVIIKQKPENNPNNTERIYQNEVLGEFYDGEGATISEEEIHQKCADIGRSFRKNISLGEDRKVYIGYDWGQKGNLFQMTGRQKGQSYSCGVVLTPSGINTFDIEFAALFAKVDPESKIEVVEEMFRRFNPQLSIGDIGDAHDLTHILQKKYGDKFLASRAVPKVTGHIKYDYDIFPKEIMFERDYYISELIGLLKNGSIRFPYGSYEKVAWLIKHCCSMDIKITQERSGELKKRYVKGPTPNDGFMALLNAYLAYKFDITQGFKINQPQFMKYDLGNKQRQIPAIIGYCKW